MKFWNNSRTVGTITGTSFFLFAVLMVMLAADWEPSGIGVLLAILWMGGLVRYIYLKKEQEREKRRDSI